MTMASILLPRLMLALVAMQSDVTVAPPTNALQRYEPKQYDMKFAVNMTTIMPAVDASLRQVIAVSDAPIVVPMIVRGAYTAIDPSTIRATMSYDGLFDQGLASRARTVEGLPYAMNLLVLPTGTVSCQVLRFEVTYRMQVWSSRINEQVAARATWPREWPKEAQGGLEPQMFIESNNPIFARYVQTVSNGQLRAVPPYYAAKDLIRAVVGDVSVTRGPVQGGVGGMYGMLVRGAVPALTNGNGSMHDVVCACVAVLRAAGIPARPVIGINRADIQHKKSRLISWGEFYLPGSGWVPFDPDVIRRKGSNQKRVQQLWKGVGDFDELNERLPLSYFYHPPADVVAPLYPAVWGWDPRPNGQPQSMLGYVSVTSTSRGKGIPDPR